MKNIKLFIVACVCLCSSLLFGAEQEIAKGGEIIELWSKDTIPDNISAKPETLTGKVNRRWRRNVSNPRLEFFKSNTGKKAGIVIVCPGGGYNGLSADNEGYSIAQWVVDHGVNAAILWYRVPDNMNGALQDIQRAIRVVRANADKLNVDSDKICVIGFSAGANLCARASTRFNVMSYKPVDEIDKLSARPSHTCLIYPAYCDEPNYRSCKLVGDGKNQEYDDYNSTYKLADNLLVSKDTPPAFIVQTLADKKYVNSSIAYYLALKKVGVDANLFVCDKGPHGYGLGYRNPQDLVSMWPKIFDKWLTIHNFKGE
ncbi:MAG: alpha/beta hydrolase [Opitutales bacterium]|nr:alpha/beta hydrolase [Opitutales bacterium]